MPALRSDRPQTGRRRLAVFGLLCLLPFACMAGEAEALAGKMLEALGGRDAWAALRGTMNDSQQNRSAPPNVIRAVIHMDFDTPRFRIEMTGPDLHTVRVVDGENAWRLTRDGRIEDLPPDRREEELRWYQGHVYRTLHRLARRDPALSVSLAEDGRLQVHERGARIAWYRLDSRGEPYAYGAHDDDTGSLFGPWEFEQDSIRHPLWVSNADGSWRVRLIRLELSPKLDPALFKRPAAKP